MNDFLIYASALFLAPFMAAILNFILMLVLSPVTDFLKNKHKERLLDVALFIQSFCGAFLLVIIIKKLLNIFALDLNWIFIIALVVLFVVNGLRRIKATLSSGDQRNIFFETYQVIADVIGILAAYFVLFLLV